MDLPKATDLEALIAALAPGLVMLGIRQRFVAGAPPPLQERVIAYAAASAVYYAIFNPTAAFAQKAWGLSVWLSNALEYVALPAALGLALAAWASLDWGAAWWAKIGLHPIHPVPTSWDYVFSRLRAGKFMLVTLSDGSQIAGKYGDNSFSSSNGAERDILIGEVWQEIDGDWTPTSSPRSILLCGRDIRSVELFEPSSRD